jgi:hypothetical protein
MCRQILLTFSVHNFKEIFSVGTESLYAERRTDMTKLVVAFRSCFTRARESKMENNLSFHIVNKEQCFVI